MLQDLPSTYNGIKGEINKVFLETNIYSFYCDSFILSMNQLFKKYDFDLYFKKSR